MTALLTLRGTPIVYYGDEIAMTTFPFRPAKARIAGATRDHPTAPSRA